VLAKWGRRGKNLSNQSKGDFTTLTAAEQVQQGLWNQKAKEGYLNIETAEYVAHMKAEVVQPLMMASPGIFENLEGNKTATGTAPQPQTAPFIPVIEWECDACGKKFKPRMNGQFPEVGQGTICPSCIQKAKTLAARRKAQGEDEVLVCADNAGLEDRFDLGIEYIVEEHKDKAMIYVYDKMGRKDEYFRIRFTTLEQWNRKNGILNITAVKNREPVVKKEVDITLFDPGMPDSEDIKMKDSDGKEISVMEAITGKKPSRTVKTGFVPAKISSMPVKGKV